MLTIEHRAMTAEERAWIEGAAKPWPRASFGGCADALGAMLGCGVIAALFVCLIPAVVLRFRVVPLTAFGWCGGAGAVVGVLLGFWYSTAERRSNRKRRAAHLRELETGQVKALHCTVSGVVELAELEDEGPGYFFQVDERRVLFLQGQYLYDYQGREDFPNDCFDVVIVPESNLVIEIRPLGRPLTPERIYDPHDEKHDLSDMYYPEDGEILGASLSTLIEDLKRLKALPPP